MSPLTLFTLMVLLLTIMLTTMGHMLPTHNMDMQKASPYECGFDPMKSSRLPFSFRFFLVAMLFLIFDLEMALLLPLPFSMLLKKTTISILPFIVFLLMLTIGLMHEWLGGALEWAE